jgi:hypothetical protein
MPLEILAEVQNLPNQVQGIPKVLNWRGFELPLESLDGFCGCAEPEADTLTTVAVFRAHRDASAPFRVLAFQGNANHRRVTAAMLESSEAVMFIPDLAELLYSEESAVS